MKLSKIRDNVFGGICAGATSAVTMVGAPIAVAIEMADGKSFSDAVETTGEGIKEVTSNAFEWGKDNAETAAQAAGLVMGAAGIVARHNAKTQNGNGRSSY